MSTSDAAMNPGISAAIFSNSSTICFSDGIDWLLVRVNSLDHQLALDRAELVPRHGEVRLAAIEHDVDEQRVVRRQRADQVVLAAERDQDVLDRIAEVERLHRLALGADDLGVA